jgi:hypothetical protein
VRMVRQQATARRALGGVHGERAGLRPPGAIGEEAVTLLRIAFFYSEWLDCAALTVRSGRFYLMALGVALSWTGLSCTCGFAVSSLCLSPDSR